MAANRDPLAGKRLDSWKEIAAFFGRDERTVKRWEKERGLPVYRVPGSSRGGVFAYAEELTEWLTGTQGSNQAAANSVTPVETPAAAVLPAVELPEASPSPQLGTAGHRRTILWWAMPLLLIGAFALLFSAGHAVQKTNFALSPPHQPNPEAQDLYLKGRFYWNKRTPEDLNRAVDFFTQAIVRDPAYAQAYVGLADCYNLLREFGSMPPSEAYPRALAAAHKAVELDPNSAEAHNSLAFALFWGSLDIAGAEREFRRALQLDPQDAQAHHWYATYLVQLGRFPEALSEIEQARRLDPSSEAIVADKGFILVMSGEQSRALALLQNMTKSEPSFESPHNYLADLYYIRREFGPYLEELDRSAHLRNDAVAEHHLAAEKRIFAESGSHGYWRSRLQDDQKRYASGESDDYRLAVDYAQLGENSEALPHLERAYEKHNLELTGLRITPEFASLYGNPEFQELLAKIGFPPIT